MAGPRSPYGFRYNDARDNYVVDAEKMRVIERIFRMVGAEGHTMNATRLAFNRGLRRDDRTGAPVCEGTQTKKPPRGSRSYPKSRRSVHD
jgi:hypothetical protein